MKSVFKKLICKELGVVSYNKYFLCYQELIADKKYDSKRLDNDEIYEDMYLKLKNYDLGELRKRLERLSDAMLLVLRISKTFRYTILAYLIAVIFLLFQGMNLWLLAGSLGLVTACLGYKSYEYILNKYCFIDAHILIIYKTVLDQLILINELRRFRDQK